MKPRISPRPLRPVRKAVLIIVPRAACLRSEPTSSKRRLRDSVAALIRTDRTPVACASVEASPQPAPVTVAVVSWNTRDLLADCLRSLKPEVDAGRASVWVVDNGSSDGSRELVKSDAPWATLVEPDENLGFGAAVDLVAERTDGPWLAAANADIALDP